MFASVVIDIPHRDLDTYYDYLVPKELESFLTRGMRVIVPFGRQERLGYVISIKETSTNATKAILSSLDVVPSIDDEMFEIVESILEETPVSYGAALMTVLPPELKMSYEKRVRLLDHKNIDLDLLDMFDQKGLWKLNKKDSAYANRLRRLQQKGVVRIETILKEKGTKKRETYYQLEHDHHYNRIEHYRSILDLFENKEMVARKDLLDLGISKSSLLTLVKHQVLSEHKRVVIRAIDHAFSEERKKRVLTPEQESALKKIEASFDRSKTLLLKGITGSGKTEVYVEAISSVIKRGGRALVLVPEIALIGPMAQRLLSRFERVAIYHSGLSNGERYDQYRIILEHQADVILGTRSAVFLPIDDLNLIVIDEEHDESYVQTEGVYYDARKVAALRSIYHKAPLILGSATPRILTMYQSEKKEIIKLTLTERPSGMKLPRIKLVDMKEEMKRDNTSIFSKTLIDAIEKRIEKGEQTILLFNRKGYAPYVLCRQCGHVPECPHCQVSLTYYRDKGVLKCRYCGHEEAFTPVCPVCQSEAVREVGYGIEYVEEALKKTIDARVIRMDAHVTRTKGSHERIWQSFANREADILLGTQMVSLGLDFAKVTLVGILMADMSLKVPSFRASERAYMLFAQMTGRSGRMYPGEAIIQGYDLEHYAVKSLFKDYDTFYEKALYERKLADYPPFRNISHILFEGTSYLQTYQEAFLFKKTFRSDTTDILGPAPAPIKKIRDRFRFTLSLKYDTLDKKKLFEMIKKRRNKELNIRYEPNFDIV
jgi:primosomal protein N' (replication factor Y) (superfamily II helicase)